MRSGPPPPAQQVVTIVTMLAMLAAILLMRTSCGRGVARLFDGLEVAADGGAAAGAPAAR